MVDSMTEVPNKSKCSHLRFRLRFRKT